MRACRSVGSVLSLVLPLGIAAAVTGCQTETPAPTPPPVARTVTPSYAAPSQLTLDPGTKMGAVIAIDSKTNLVQVLVTPVQGSADVKEGDQFVFTDRGQNPVNGVLGTVISVGTSGGRPLATLRLNFMQGSSTAPTVEDYAFCLPGR